MHRIFLEQKKYGLYGACEPWGAALMLVIFVASYSNQTENTFAWTDIWGFVKIRVIFFQKSFFL